MLRCRGSRIFLPCVFFGVFFGVLFGGWIGPGARAADTLPYVTRMHFYSGFGSPIQGDIRTVGMAGATGGLGDTFLAATVNPAGLAMALDGADTSITHNDIHDGNIQDYSSVIGTGGLGAALNDYPWGFSIGTVPTGLEGQQYLLPATSSPYAGMPADFLVAAHEFRIGVGHVFMHDLLSVGLSLNIGDAEEQIKGASGSGASALNDDHHASALGATLGAMYQLPHRFLLGASFTTPMHYAFDTATSTPELPGFVQPLDVPARGEVALGWIPNRFIRGDLSLAAFSTTRQARLLRDDATMVGSSISCQPKAGVAYLFADYLHIRGSLFAGTYYEFSRIDGAPSRLHRTAGVELKAWVFTAGLGIDHANQYQDFIYSVGVDVGIVLQYLRLMPKPYHETYEHMVPDPFRFDEEGLPRPLVKSWHPSEGPDMNPLKIIGELPENARKEVDRLRTGENPIDLSAPQPQMHSPNKHGPRKRRVHPAETKKPADALSP